MTENVKSGMGYCITSLILGILGTITAFIPCFGFWAVLFGLISIIFGGIGLGQSIKADENKGLGMAGLILGVVAVILVILRLYLWTNTFTGSSTSIVY